jgi:hypothetical protein
MRGQIVFFTKANTANLDQSDASARARAAAQAAAQNAAVAARTAAAAAQATAQSAAAGVSNGVQQGVYTARRWTAPRLESAADYCTTTVAPSVAAALRNTAKQVSPDEPANTARRRMLTWSLLGTAILATVGAAIALARYQFRAAASSESEEIGETGTDVSGTSTGTTTTPTTTPTTTSTTTSTGPVISAAQASPGGTSASPSKTAANKTATTADTSVNGHVSSNGW